MGFAEFVSSRDQRIELLFCLVLCLITMFPAACKNRMISAIEPATSTAPTSTPGEFNSNLENNKDPRQNSPSKTVGSKILKLKCKDAEEKHDQQLCNAIIDADLRADSFFMDSFEITYCNIDLNDDGSLELVIWESSWAGTSGGSLWVFDKKRTGYRKLFEAEMTWTPIILLPTKHHGWRDFSYLIAGGGMKPTFATVSYRKNSYGDRENLSVEAPDGEILIDKDWKSSVFGPMSLTKNR